MDYKLNERSSHLKGDSLLQRGSITLIKGTMFSGKTSMLLSLVTKEKIMNGKYVLMKYSLDNRYNTNGVTSHSLQTDDKCLSVFKCVEIESKVNLWEVDKIFIDEGQFYSDLYDFCTKWMLRGKHIFISALEFYANQTPWPQIVKIAPLCIKIELTAICIICHGIATTCQLLHPENDQEDIDIGGVDKYRSVCGACLLLENIQPLLCDTCTSFVCPNDFEVGEDRICLKCFRNR
jgi:thymidine kinase